MIVNRKELELVTSKLPYLYDKFAEVDENGIKILIKCEIENLPESIPETIIQKMVTYLLDVFVRILKKTKLPIIIVLIYENNGFCMDFAYTGRKMNLWTKWMITVYFLKLRLKYPSVDYDLRHRMVALNFEGRDCICCSIRF